MSDKRMIFLDVDGTIVEYGSVIAPSTGRAVRAARANGHLVYICTGRAHADVVDEVWQIGFDGAITNGGAFVERDGEIVVAHPMPPEKLEQLETYLREHDIAYFLQTHDGVYATPGLAERTDAWFAEQIRAHAAELQAAGMSAADLKPVIRSVPIERVDRAQVAKAVFVSPVAGTVEHAREALGDGFHVIPESVSLPGASNGEIVQAGVTKGSAITEVLALVGASAQNAVGIGDSWNDAEMFEVVGTSIAMGNAHPDLQRLAGHTTTSVLQDGVANAFSELGLI